MKTDKRMNKKKMNESGIFPTFQGKKKKLVVFLMVGCSKKRKGESKRVKKK